MLMFTKSLLQINIYSQGRRCCAEDTDHPWRLKTISVEFHTLSTSMYSLRPTDQVFTARPSQDTD